MIIYSHLRDTLIADQVARVAIASPCPTPSTILRLIQTPDQDTEIRIWYKGKCFYHYRSTHFPTEFMFFPMNLKIALHETMILEVINLRSEDTDTCICFIWETAA